MFLTSLKQTCNEYLNKFSENQSAPKLENRKTSPCSPCAPNLLHVLVSRIPGYHNLCSPDWDTYLSPSMCADKVAFVPKRTLASSTQQHKQQTPGQKAYKADKTGPNPTQPQNLHLPHLKRLIHLIGVDITSNAKPPQLQLC